MIAITATIENQEDDKKITKNGFHKLEKQHGKIKAKINILWIRI